MTPVAIGFCEDSPVRQWWRHGAAVASVAGDRVAGWWAAGQRWLRSAPVARGPLLPAAALFVAAMVSLSHGQPPPVDRPVGVSIPVRDTPTDAVAVGPLVVVTAGRAVRVDPTTQRAVAVPLPAGARVLQLVTAYGAQALLARYPSGRTVAYLLPDDGPVRALGPARAVVPDMSDALFWLDTGGEVRAYTTSGTPTGVRIAVPDGFTPISGVRDQIVASGSLLVPPVTAPDGASPTQDAAPPVETVLLSQHGASQVLFTGEALDVAAGVVLARDGDQLLVFDLRTAELSRLPSLSAVRLSGPGRLADDGAGFAVLGRVNDHAELVIGPIHPESEADLQLLSLGGAPAVPYPPAAIWTRGGSVLAVRPDSRLVYFKPGRRSGVVLGLTLPEVTGVALVA